MPTLLNCDLGELAGNPGGINPIGEVDGVGLFPEVAAAFNVRFRDRPSPEDAHHLATIADSGHDDETTVPLTWRYPDPITPEYSHQREPIVGQSRLNEWMIRTGLVRLDEGSLSRMRWNEAERKERLIHVARACGAAIAGPVGIHQYDPWPSLGRPSHSLPEDTPVDTVIVSANDYDPRMIAHGIAVQAGKGTSIGRIIFLASTQTTMDLDHVIPRNTGEEYQAEVRATANLPTEYAAVHDLAAPILHTAGVRDVRIVGLNDNEWARPIPKPSPVAYKKMDETELFIADGIMDVHRRAHKGKPDRYDIAAAQLVAEHGNVLRDGTTVLLDHKGIPALRLGMGIRAAVLDTDRGYDRSYNQLYRANFRTDSYTRPIHGESRSDSQIEQTGRHILYTALRLAEDIQRNLRRAA